MGDLLRDHVTTWGVLLILAVAGCSSEKTSSPPELVLSYQVATWFQDGWSFYDVSPDEGEGVFGARFGRTLFDLERGVEIRDRHRRCPGIRRRRVLRCGGSSLAQGHAGRRRRLVGSRARRTTPSIAPSGRRPRLSADGTRVAYYRGTAGSGPRLWVGSLEAPVGHDLDGLVTGVGWSPDGSAVYALSFRADGTSALYRVDADGEVATLVREQLDAPARFNSIAVTGDGANAYLSLVGPGPPDAEARHDPEADRDLDIYNIDLTTGVLEPVVTTPGDDFRPLIRGGNVYWTHNDIRDTVVVLPTGGGEPHQVASDAQIPSWSADGRRLAFTVGGWMLADWALNMDAWVVDVDDGARPISEPAPLIVGYHEDFTPAWSPDGRWLAYHSHRSVEPVAHYFAEGGTDDIYLRESEAPMDAEIRLMDFGWEVGVADWDRDGDPPLLHLVGAGLASGRIPSVDRHHRSSDRPVGLVRPTPTPRGFWRDGVGGLVAGGRPAGRRGTCRRPATCDLADGAGRFRCGARARVPGVDERWTRLDAQRRPTHLRSAHARCPDAALFVRLHARDLDATHGRTR